MLSLFLMIVSFDRKKIKLILLLYISRMPPFPKGQCILWFPLFCMSYLLLLHLMCCVGAADICIFMMTLPMHDTSVLFALNALTDLVACCISVHVHNS